MIVFTYHMDIIPIMLVDIFFGQAIFNFVMVGLLFLLMTKLSPNKHICSFRPGV